MIKKAFLRLLAWFISRWVRDPDLRTLVIDLGDYTPMDRYRDFRKTFGTPEGQRTLSQIITWGRVNRSVFDKEPTVMALKEGERNLALKIVAGLTEPVKQETERNRRKWK